MISALGLATFAQTELTRSLEFLWVSPGESTDGSPSQKSQVCQLPVRKLQMLHRNLSSKCIVIGCTECLK
jgi:hypothetical protein